MRRLSMTLIISGIALGIWSADQLTKWLVHDYYELDMQAHYEVIDGFLTIHHAHNTGAIGGILSGNNPVLITLSIVALVLLIAFRRSFVTSHKEHLLALGLIAGGIVGNLTDRIARGHVEDFLILHIGDFPITYVFNIADAAICAGVAIYIIALLLPRKKVASPPTGSETVEQMEQRK